MTEILHLQAVMFVRSIKNLTESQLWVSLCGALYGLSLVYACDASSVSSGLFLFYFFSIFSSYRLSLVLMQDKIPLHTVLYILLPQLYCVAYMYSHYTERSDWMIWAATAVLAGLYNFTILNFKLRSVPFLKAFYIGLIWALFFSIQIPVAFRFNTFLFTFLVISAMVVCFDIRDVDEDTFPTIANTAGIPIAKFTAILLLCLSLFLLPDAWSVFPFFIFVALNVLYTLFSSKDRSREYYSFWMEGTLALPFLIQIVLRIFAL